MFGVVLRQGLVFLGGSSCVCCSRWYTRTSVVTKGPRADTFISCSRISLTCAYYEPDARSEVGQRPFFEALEGLISVTHLIKDLPDLSHLLDKYASLFFPQIQTPRSILEESDAWYPYFQALGLKRYSHF